MLNSIFNRNRINNASSNIITPVNNNPIKILSITVHIGPISAHLDKYKRSNIENGIIIERMPRKQYIPEIKKDLSCMEMDWTENIRKIVKD